MVVIANGVLFFSFIIAGYGAWTAFIGGKWQRNDMINSAQRSAEILFVLLSLLIILLLSAFINHDFSIKYIASYSNRTLPLIYTISALWAGQSGSLLLWAWLLSLFAVIILWHNRSKNYELIPYVLGVIFLTAFFFIGLMVYATNPFELLPEPVADGKGLNPMLQNPGMIMHPPLLYIGYVGFTIPFAFAMAALLKNKLDADWIRITRRWTLISWLFLALGNLFGAKWAYVELGWGGYWAWDPVENASLMPWMTATAYLHSVMIQEKRGMLKIWNLLLIMLTFILTIFGTFITRSGIISSVHSFGTSDLGPLFLSFLCLTLFVSLFLLWSRWHQIQSENQLDALLSRESSFFFNNLLFVGMTFSALVGTIFPLVSEFARGIKITVGPPFFNQVNVPIGLALLALMGMCPLLAWKKSSQRNLRNNFIVPFFTGLLCLAVLLISGMRSAYPLISFSIAGFVLSELLMEFHRGAIARVHVTGKNILNAMWDLIMNNKRRHGGYIVHLGIVMIFVGITGSSAFQKEKSLKLAPGESAEIGDYKLDYEGLVDRSTENAQITAAKVQVQKSGKVIATMFPARQHYQNFDPVSEVDIRQTLKEDLYCILSGWDEKQNANFKVLVIPLVAWIWIGTIVMTIGTLIALGPDRFKKKYNKIVGQFISSQVREVEHV